MKKKNSYLEEKRAQRKRLKNEILRDVRKGLNSTDAAIKHGVCERMLWQWQSVDPEFQKKLREGRIETVRCIKKLILTKLRSGLIWKDSVKNIGRTAQALHVWRIRDPEFDEKVVALLKQQRKRKSLETKAARLKQKK